MSELKNAVRCKGCGEYIELPPQEVKTVVKTEPCRCGMTESTRETQHLTTMISIIAVSLLLTLFGGCWLNQYYTTEQIKAIPHEYEIKKALPSFPGAPEHEVKKKGEENPGIQVDPRIPVRPETPKK